VFKFTIQVISQFIYMAYWTAKFSGPQV